MLAQPIRIPSRARFIAAIAAAISLACPGRPALPVGPQSLLRIKPQGGRLQIDTISIGDEAREAILATQSWSVVFPKKATMTFGVGARFDGTGEAPGWGRFVVAIDGREIARETVNPRVSHDWKDVTVDLDTPPSRGVLSVSIRFTDKDGVDLSRPKDLALAMSDPVIHDKAAYGQKRGVIFISIDTLRRDHVGAYGYAKPTTPTLDALAKDGMLADDAVSVSSWTLPSHLSMMTSALPGTHGGIDLKQGFNGSVPTVAQMLKAQGVATHAVTSHLYVSKTYGIDAGFDSMNFRQDRLAENVANHAMDLVDRFGDRPFFIFLHFYDPHWHYAPPADLLKIFEVTPYTGKVGGNLNDFQKLRPDQVKPADLDHLRALYDGEIRYTDNQIARLMTHLKERDLPRNTLMVVTSDHGEEFLEHGSWEHQKTLYDEVIRIPMIVSGPGVAARRESQPVDLLDIAPTILDFMGVKAAPSMNGVSLLRPIPDHREMYGETDNTVDGSRLSFLRNGSHSWKAILRSDRAKKVVRDAEWFDLALDPAEKTNRPPAPALRSSIEGRARDAALTSRSTSPTRTVELSAEQKEKLKALGYVK